MLGRLLWAKLSAQVARSWTAPYRSPAALLSPCRSLQLIVDRPGLVDDVVHAAPRPGVVDVNDDRRPAEKKKTAAAVGPHRSDQFHLVRPGDQQIVQGDIQNAALAGFAIVFDDTRRLAIDGEVPRVACRTPAS